MKSVRKGATRVWISAGGSRRQADGFQGVYDDDADDAVAECARGFEGDGAAHGVAYENDLLVGNSLHNGCDILAVLFHGPVGAAFGGAAVAGEIDGDHCVFRLEGARSARSSSWRRWPSRG